MKYSKFLPLALCLIFVSCSLDGTTGTFTVRTISSHYPHGDENSETTLIVYENGESGHTKEVLCMFPPDFQLDGNLTTMKLDEMGIPPLIKRGREVFKKCGEDYTCTYKTLEKENPKIAEATVWLKANLEDENNDETFALYYRNQALFGKEQAVLQKGVIELLYRGIEDAVYNGETVPVPELTGIKKVRVGKAAKEYSYSGTIGYLCEKVE